MALTGPSGCGKSTLLQLLAGPDRPDSGSVEVAGYLLDNPSDDQLARFRRDHIGFDFQFFQLLESMTALVNVALACLIGGVKRPAALSRARGLLDLLGLLDKAGSWRWPPSYWPRVEMTAGFRFAGGSAPSRWSIAGRILGIGVGTAGAQAADRGQAAAVTLAGLTGASGPSLSDPAYVRAGPGAADALVADLAATAEILTPARPTEIADLPPFACCRPFLLLCWAR